MARFNDGSVLEYVHRQVIQNTADIVWIEVSVMALKIVQPNLVKAACVHDHVIGICVRDTKESDIQ